MRTKVDKNSDQDRKYLVRICMIYIQDAKIIYITNYKIKSKYFVMYKWYMIIFTKETNSLQKKLSREVKDGMKK